MAISYSAPQFIRAFFRFLLNPDTQSVKWCGERNKTVNSNMSESSQQKTPAEEVEDTTKQKSGPRAGVDGTSSTRAPQTAKKPFTQQAATASWLAPVLACFLSYATKPASRSGNMIMLTIEVLFIVAGLVFGIIALFGIRKHGREGILKPAIAGIIVNVSLILLVISIVVFVGVANKRRLRQEGEQIGMDAFLEYPGWYGAAMLPDAIVSIASLNDRSQAAREFNVGFTANVSVLIIGVENSAGKSTVTIDPSSLRLNLADGTVKNSLPTITVLRTARESREKALKEYSGPFAVPPGGQLRGRIAFVPYGFDMSKVVSISVLINGRDTLAEGAYMTGKQKTELVRLGLQVMDSSADGGNMSKLLRKIKSRVEPLGQTKPLNENILVPVADNVLLVNVGVETYGGLFEPIITAGGELPLSEQEIFSTAADYQETINVHVLQGFRPLAKYNKTLVRFLVTELPRELRGVPKIVITLQIDQNGRMKIQAVEEAIGKDAVILVTATDRLTPSDIKTMQKEALQFAKQDEEEATLIEMRNEAELLLYMAQSVLDGKPPVSKTDRKHLMRLMTDVRNHITDPRSEQLTTSTNALMNQLDTVIQKMDVP